MKSVTNYEAFLTQFSAIFTQQDCSDHKLLSRNRPKFTDKSFSSALFIPLIKCYSEMLTETFFNINTEVESVGTYRMRLL